MENYELSCKKYTDHLVNLNSMFTSPMNEADTRSKLIDQIMEFCLDWEYCNVFREEKSENGYLDYHYKSNENEFVIEAKKNGLYFTLPFSKKKININSNFTTDEKTKAAIEQAKGYCLSKGISIGCITNGSQFIVFDVYINTKYNAYVFNGFQDIFADFTNFYNIFSPYSNAKINIAALVSNDSNFVRMVPQFSQSLISIFDNSDERVSRNEINKYCERIISTYFGDLTTKDKDLFDLLYCTDRNTENYNDRMKSCFVDHLPKLEIETVQEEEFEKDFKAKNKYIKDRIEINSEIMLVVGGTGAGKSTFIHQFFKYKLDDKLKKDLIILNIDFLEVGSELVDTRELILKESLKQIREKYIKLRIDDYDTLIKIFEGDINRLKNGSLKPIFEKNKGLYEEKISEFLYEKQINEVEFSSSVLRYIGFTKLPYQTICIIVDNVDQKDVEIQIQAFKVVHELSKKFNSLLVLSLREETYWSLKDTKPFDAYSNYAYHITAPKINYAIKKRLDAAIYESRKNKDTITIEYEGKNIKFEMAKFFEIIGHSFFSKGELESFRIFKDLSCNDLRYALYLFRIFVISGHTNTLEFINTYLKNGSYTIPQHAVIRSLALGDFKYFKSDRREIMNVFRYDNDGFYSHFTKLEILRILKNNSNSRTVYGYGFYEIKEIYNTIGFLFMSYEALNDTLFSLIQRKLLETDYGYVNPLNSKYIRLTPAGFFYVDDLIYRFAYLERVVEDTFIKSNDTFNKLKEMSKEIEFSELKANNPNYIVNARLARISLLIEYLNEQQEIDNKFLNTQNYKFDFVNSIQEKFDAEVHRIRKSSQQIK